MNRTLCTLIAGLGLAASTAVNAQHDEVPGIIAQNPQLKTVPGWPSNSEFNISNCPHNLKGGQIAAPDLQVTSKHRCIAVHERVNQKAYETRVSPKNFLLVLYLGTPRVWKVYDRTSTNSGKLVAEFDTKGNRGSSPLSESTAAQDPATAPQPTQAPSIEDTVKSTLDKLFKGR